VPELSLLKLLGGAAQQKTVLAPEPVDAQVVAIRDGDVYLLPASRHSAPERKIVGVTVRVKDLAAAQRALARGGTNLPIQTHNGKPQSLFLPPSLTHGTWLELRDAD